MILTFTSIQLQQSVSLVITLHISAASIVKHTLKMHPNRNSDHVSKSNNGSVDNNHHLQIHPRQVHSQTHSHHHSYVHHLSPVNVPLNIDPKHLEKPNSN